MSISKRKLKANRANAQKSIGPRTAAGLETVSQNRTTHGLSGRFRVLPCEDQAVYDDLVERFLEAEQPADHVEREVVAMRREAALQPVVTETKMVRHTWLSERATRFQEACFLFQPPTPEQQARESQSCGVLMDIHVYVRYQAAHDRAYQRAANELAKHRKDRHLAEIGFESQKRAEAEAEHREQRQNQRDELHSYKVAAAKLRLEHQQERCLNANSAIQAPAPPLPGDRSHNEPAVCQLGEDYNNEPAVCQLGEDYNNEPAVCQLGEDYNNEPAVCQLGEDYNNEPAICQLGEDYSTTSA